MDRNQARPLAVVTGASSGIGLELAREFARNGFDLLLCAEDDRLSQATRQVGELGTRVQAAEPPGPFAAVYNASKAFGFFRTRAESAMSGIMPETARGPAHRKVA